MSSWSVRLCVLTQAPMGGRLFTSRANYHSGVDRQMSKESRFLGLGVMGAPMAGHLVKHGGYDVDGLITAQMKKRKAVDWVRAHGGASAVDEPAEAVEGAELIFMCLGDDP